jgi:steroid 5-alpha reductase family enzyme
MRSLLLSTETHVHTFHEAIHDSHVFLGFGVGMCALVNICACMVSRRRSSGRTFEALSGVTVDLVILASFVVRGTWFPRQIVVTSLMLAWGTRLSGFLYLRNLETPVSSDVVIARAIWAATCAAPALLINALQHDRVAFNIGEFFAITLACMALIIETLADLQKLAWHRFHVVIGRPGKDSTSPPVCSHGLWRWSRHPNLFGEMLFHSAVYGVCSPALPVWVAFFPLLLSLQIFFLNGGVVRQEQQRGFIFRFFPSYINYKNSTSPLLPMPPALWRALPATVKRFPFMEIDLYDQADRDLVDEINALQRTSLNAPTIAENENEHEHD